MRPVLPLIAWLLLLSSCSSPPKPPTVDESAKRPVNSVMAVELQVCRNDLHNTRIVATESSRIAESTAATLERLAARQQALASLQAPKPNRVFTVHFKFGSTRVDLPSDTASALLADARAAPLVLLRGRTDGSTDAPAESRLARDRAHAVRDYLVGAGVDPARIRATYQPAGDHAADNSSASGKAMNRRVEIEVYRALPVAVSSSAAATP
jgi:outer membrane protein OmpA-like peptidoglycan-associated protein